jgi:hypothetical protein
VRRRAEARPYARLAMNVVWFVLAAIGVLLLRRDVDELNDMQVQTGQFLAGTAALMVGPMYVMNLGFEALFGSVMNRIGVRPEWTGAERALTLLDRGFELGFIALGIYTVGLLGAIDLFPGIMAMITLFIGVLLGGMGRLPMGRLTAGCGGLIAAFQMLLIGFILLFVYLQTPEGGDLSIGALLAMLGPGLRMFVIAGMGLYGLWGDVRRGVPPSVE